MSASLPRWTARCLVLAAMVGSAVGQDGPSFRADRYDGLAFELPEHDFVLRAGGRLHFDAGVIDSDRRRREARGDVRRLRPYAIASLGKSWILRVEGDVGERDRWRNVYLEYTAPEEVLDGVRLRVRAGNQTARMGSEGATSSNHMLFLERSMANRLAPGFHHGLSVRATGEDWALTSGVYRHPFDGSDSNGVQALNAVTRVTWVPYREDGKLLHLGSWVEFKDVDAGDRYRVRARPGTRISTRRLLDTGRLQRVHETWTSGAEIAWQDGPWLAAAEFSFKHVDRSGADPLFYGWSLLGSWVVGRIGYDSAERERRRRYAKGRGAFHSPEFDEGRGLLSDGAWRAGLLELGARIDGLDLQDTGVMGGEGVQFTLGANYYFDRNLRLMTNYGFAYADPNGSGLDEELHFLAMRMQLFF